MRILEFFSTNWQIISGIIGLAIGAVGIVIGYWKYLDVRKRELAWKRTEFVFTQSRYINDDKDIQNIVSVLMDIAGDVTIDAIFDPTSQLPRDKRVEYILGLDRLCCVLDWLAYAVYDAKTLTLPEVANFGWYLRMIRKYPAIIEYCRDGGFYDVLRLAKEVVYYNKKQEAKRRVLGETSAILK